jgi:hypothetical protein
MSADVVTLIPTGRQRAALAHIARAPVIQHPQANAFGFPPVEVPSITTEDTAPPSRFMPAEDLGAVYLGTVRLDRYQVAALAALFSREAARSGDWSLYDALNAARDGLTPEPPEAA